MPPSLLQIGANEHSSNAAFAHDPVPSLIRRGWSATLLEPQPGPASSLRTLYTSNSAVRVVQAAMCQDDATTSVPLYFINGSKTLGANESDFRCMGGNVISGTASFTRSLIMAHQRFYKYTPSQCANCAKFLGRPLPPTCMRRVYSDNLDVISVPCARAADLLSGSETALLVVVDAEGEDDHIVTRLIELRKGAPPPVLVYEQAHLKKDRKHALARRLRSAGMVPYNRSAMRAPFSPLSAASWSDIRRALTRVDMRDNAAWVLYPSTAGALRRGD